ncbi:MAG: DNA topoisomerase III [Selenomonadaceae bacterium]|nr:DNA topoisomerase III [Selenomonadaceae bacterium]
MKLFIAEKPSLAQAIAGGLGNGTKKDGCIVIGNNVVTWCFGHILEQLSPNEYNDDYKYWKMETLPIIPSPWKLKVKPDAKKQFCIVKDLIKQADIIVNAGDPDREGQLLIDEVLEYVGVNKPVQRILLNALDDKSVKEALTDIRKNEDFIGLRNSALGRSRADWLIGMNLSRAYTVQARKAGYDEIFSVGRVMTPTMSLVVRREDEIANFKPVNHYGIRGTFNNDEANFTADWFIPKDIEGLDKEDRLIDKSVAEKVLDKLKNLPQGTVAHVTNVEENEKKEAQRLPYSLSALQIDAGRIYGYSPQLVLDTMQSLYEKKLTTYPRSDCDYLPENQKENSLGIIGNLKGLFSADIDKIIEKTNTNIHSRAWNDKKITAHHAIIPTTIKADFSSLNDVEKNCYFLVAKAYLAQFLPMHSYLSVKIMISIASEAFIGKGKTILEQGWKELYIGDKSDKEDDADTILPQVVEGQTVNFVEATLVEKTTKPPTRFTEATLLKAMKEIYKYVRDENLKKELKECSGIGTEATRATIIKKLQDTGLLALSKKYLVPTDKSKVAISIYPEDLTYPDITAVMENKLEEVQKGNLSLEDFIALQLEMLNNFLEEAKKIELAPPKDVPKCPDCGKAMRRYKGKNGFFWGCTGYPECSTTALDNKGKPLFIKKAECPRCKSVMQRFPSKNNPKQFYWHCTNKECNLYLTDDAKNKQPIVVRCPECKKGYLVLRDGKKGPFWSCSDYQKTKCNCIRQDENGKPKL